MATEDARYRETTQFRYWSFSRPALLGQRQETNAEARAAIAAGRDDTLPVLTGVRIEIEGDTVTLAATDRYRFAVREFL